MKWRDIREVLNAVLRNAVVRIILGLLAALGAADQVSEAPVVPVAEAVQTALSSK